MSWGGFSKIVLGGDHSIKSHVLGGGRSVATSYITVLGVVYISCWIIIVLGGVVRQHHFIMVLHMCINNNVLGGGGGGRDCPRGCL